MIGFKTRIFAISILLALGVGASKPLSAQTQIPTINPEISKLNPSGSGDANSRNAEGLSTQNRHCANDVGDEFTEDNYFKILHPEETEGLTLESHPTLLAYIPPTSATHLSVMVTRERDGARLFESTRRVESNAIQPIKFPQYLPPLVVNERYVWSVSLLCESVITPFNPSDQLVLQRRSLDSLPEVEGAMSVERAMNLGELGIWQDMASRLYYESTDRLNPDAIANLKALIAQLGVTLSETTDI